MSADNSIPTSPSQPSVPLQPAGVQAPELIAVFAPAAKGTRFGGWLLNTADNDFGHGI